LPRQIPKTASIMAVHPPRRCPTGRAARCRTPGPADHGNPIDAGRDLLHDKLMRHERQKALGHGLAGSPTMEPL
jgi:hypothetical protein